MSPAPKQKNNDKIILYVVSAVAVLALLVGIFGVMKAKSTSDKLANSEAVSSQEKAYAQREFRAIEARLRSDLGVAKRVAKNDAKGAEAIASKEAQSLNSKLDKLSKQVNTQYAEQQAENQKLQDQINNIKKLIKELEKAVGN